jgi:hypothetical protein
MNKTKRALRDGMTVAELIEALKTCDQEAKVVFSYDYGDYTHTTVADVVNEMSSQDVVYSDYHNKLKVIDDDGRDHVRDQEIVSTVVVIN